jgi:hypothetical protein
MALTMQQQKLLLISLTMKEKIALKDASIFDDMEVLNSLTDISIEDDMLLKEVVTSLLDNNPDILDVPFIKSVFEKITNPKLNASYLLAKIDLLTVKWGDTISMAAAVNKVLDSGMNFNSSDEFYIYRLLTKIAVSSRDIATIKRVAEAINNVTVNVPPMLTNVSEVVVKPNKVAATSNEDSTLYLVLSIVNVTDKPSLDQELALNRGVSLITYADANAQIPTDSLPAGTYVVYAVDTNEVVSAPSHIITILDQE